MHILHVLSFRADPSQYGALEMIVSGLPLQHSLINSFVIHSHSTEIFFSTSQVLLKMLYLL